MKIMRKIFFYLCMVMVIINLNFIDVKAKKDKIDSSQIVCRYENKFCTKDITNPKVAGVVDEQDCLLNNGVVDSYYVDILYDGAGWNVGVYFEDKYKVLKESKYNTFDKTFNAKDYPIKVYMYPQPYPNRDGFKCPDIGLLSIPKFRDFGSLSGENQFRQVCFLHTSPELSPSVAEANSQLIDCIQNNRKSDTYLSGAFAAPSPGFSPLVPIPNMISINFGFYDEKENPLGRKDFISSKKIIDNSSNLSFSGSKNPEPLEDIEKVSFCSEERVLTVFRIIGYILFALKSIIPLILIILASIDLARGMVLNKDDSNKETLKRLVIRLVLGIIIFLVPLILDYLLTLVDGAVDTASEFSHCTTCLLNPTSKKCSNYLKSSVPVPEKPKNDGNYESGDVNMDGHIDCSDVTIISDALNNIDILSEEQQKLADINGDNKITMDDCDLLKNNHNLKCNFELGDVNMDGDVNCSDYNIIVEYAKDDKKVNLSYYQLDLADINKDGKIDNNDAVEFENKFLWVCNVGPAARGDLNEDNKIDCSDIELIENYLNKSGTLNNRQLELADVNFDNVVNDDDINDLEGKFNLSCYTKLGDVNMDGQVDCTDVVMIQNYINNNIDFDDDQRIFADANIDGRIDELDIYEIISTYSLSCNG